jgi:hypothetical protein
MIKVKVSGVKEALKTIDEKIVTAAMTRALNETATSTKAKALDIVTQEYNVKRSRVSRYVKLRTRASVRNAHAEVTAEQIGIPAIEFDARATGYRIRWAGKGTHRTRTLARTKRTRGAVTVRVTRARGRTVLPPKFGNVPFLARMKSGHVGVFEITGEGQARTGRPKIKQRFGPGAALIIGSHKNKRVMRKYIQVTFDKEFPRQLNWYKNH